MSRFHRATVSCPRCGNDIDAVLWDLIDAGADPDLKVRLLQKKIQEQECQNCGHAFILAEPLIYREDQHHLLVFYWPEAKGEITGLPDPDDFPGWHLRRVGHYNELIELIHIRDHHCDDRLMAVVKVAIRSRGGIEPTPAAVFFLTADDQVMRFLVRTAEDEWLTADFPTELYLNTEAFFMEKLPPDTGWQLIDEAYAVDWINRESASAG